MSKNILVTGSNGQLGSELRELEDKFSQYKFFFTDVDELDICVEDAVDGFVSNNSIDTIINCAAYTAVDKAEDEYELANKVNSTAVKILSKVAKQYSIKLIHISTDYVFDGTACKPYSEESETAPQSVYGKTKLNGELEIKKMNLQNSVIIRTSWVYSSFGSNFLKTMLSLGKTKTELGVVFDQVGTPTYAGDLAKAILDIMPHIENTSTEIYHYSNEGVLSWYDFTKEIMELSELNCQINPIETYQFPKPAPRPNYSVLNKSKIKNEFNITIPYWKDSLKRCINLCHKG